MTRGWVMGRGEEKTLRESGGIDDGRGKWSQG